MSEEHQENAELNQLAHDLRHCLFVIGMATEMLPDAQDDGAKLAEIRQSITDERQQAAKLVDQILRAAVTRDGGS